MDTLEVLDGGGPSQVEEIASDADVSSAMSLTGGDVGERVLDGGAFPQHRAARRGLLELAILALSSFAAPSHTREALFCVGGVTLLLLFVGIHNAWDGVSYHVLVNIASANAKRGRPETRQETGDEEKEQSN